MDSETGMRPLSMLPEMLLFGGGLLVLISGSFLPRKRQWANRIIAAAALAGSIVAAAAGMTGPDQSAFEGTFAVDTATSVARMAAAAGVLLVLAVAGGEIAGSARESETYALLLFATAGTLILAGADDLLVLATGFLLASIPLYGLIGLARSPQAAEAAMKTYLMGALFGIVLLSGVSLLYGVTGTTRYHELAAQLGDAPAAVVAAGFVGVMAGLMFKARRCTGAFLGSRRGRGNKWNGGDFPDDSAENRCACRDVSPGDDDARHHSLAAADRSILRPEHDPG